MKILQLNSITDLKFQTMKTMKTMKNISFYALLSIAMIGCSDDDTAPAQYHHHYNQSLRLIVKHKTKCFSLFSLFSLFEILNQ